MTQTIDTLTAEIGARRAPTWVASMWASVVFPVPGGPQRISDGSDFPAAMRASSLPGPRRCPWPANSSKVFGLIRSASGWPTRRLRALERNRSMDAPAGIECPRDESYALEHVTPTTSLADCGDKSPLPRWSPPDM